MLLVYRDPQYHFKYSKTVTEVIQVEIKECQKVTVFPLKIFDTLTGKYINFTHITQHSEKPMK